jgi:hypothetical protein
MPDTSPGGTNPSHSKPRNTETRRRAPWRHSTENAIAGPLFEYFGTEMATALGTCAHCGTRAQIGGLVVYARAPGTGVRCRHCGNVVMVIVSIRDELRVDASAVPDGACWGPADGTVTEPRTSLHRNPFRTPAMTMVRPPERRHGFATEHDGVYARL